MCFSWALRNALLFRPPTPHTFFVTLGNKNGLHPPTLLALRIFWTAPLYWTLITHYKILLLMFWHRLWLTLCDILLLLILHCKWLAPHRNLFLLHSNCIWLSPCRILLLLIFNCICIFFGKTFSCCFYIEWLVPVIVVFNCMWLVPSEIPFS